jgi:hypothetical protein
MQIDVDDEANFVLHYMLSAVLKNMFVKKQ